MGRHAASVAAETTEMRAISLPGNRWSWVAKLHPLLYAKAIIAIAGAVGSVAVAAYHGDQHISYTEFANIALAAVGAFQVWYADEGGKNYYAKTITAFVTAFLIAIQSDIAGKGTITITEWIQAGLAAGVACGIIGVKNKEI
jgi:hypothetical protein